ncbi:alpha/beta fold hydrolase [Paenibacillus septentrionalis]|uniref:Alpha/beta fold hydrolase n=1 Tax=Paenibacillus septentrionalis TaxID=429342 RepID=A0ABW1UZ83_9BACL
MEERTFRTDGCELRYWVRPADSRKWIIFLHGAGCDHLMFERQFPAMPEDYNIVAWDARGHGQSRLDPGKRFNYQDMLKDFQRLTEHYNMEDIVLIGQSMGGNLSQDLLAQYPERIRKVVLIGCTDNAQSLSFSERVQLSLAIPTLRLIPWTSLAKLSGDASGETEYAKAYTRKAIMSLGKQRFVDVMKTLRIALRHDPQYTFPIPVLLILGEKDKTGNIVKAMSGWPRKDRNAVLKLIPNAGHNANMDNPDLVNRHIINYLAQP